MWPPLLMRRKQANCGYHGRRRRVPPRPVASLIEKASAHPVTVMRARAGLGKTMACATWAVAAARPRRIAWLTLDEGDRSPARFWADVTAALAADTVRSSLRWSPAVATGSTTRPPA